MKIKRRVTIILLVIFVIGLSVLLYPSISQYWNSRVQSTAIAEFEKTLIENTEEMKKEIEEAHEYNKKLSKLQYPLMQYQQIGDYDKIIDVNASGMMGYISIDKIRVEIPIYHGTSNEVLNSAAGHIKGTSFPVGGESTHSVISAHRGLPSAKLFTELDKLEVGDIFTIKILNDVATYQVDQIKTVLPDDVRDLAIEQGKDYVTLLTCTPYGINTHRLLVRGTRIANLANKNIYITADAYIIDRLIVMPIIAMPVLIALTLYVSFKPVKKIKGDDDTYEI